MAKHKSRAVDRSHCAQYWQRGAECLNAARTPFVNQQWNASAITAIHAGIAGLDALCVYFLGQRHAGPDHDGAVALFRSVRGIPAAEMDGIAVRISRILKIKNMAEYEERLVYRKEAEKILQDAERLLDAAKKHLPK